MQLYASIRGNILNCEKAHTQMRMACTLLPFIVTELIWFGVTFVHNMHSNGYKFIICEIFGNLKTAAIIFHTHTYLSVDDESINWATSFWDKRLIFHLVSAKTLLIYSQLDFCFHAQFSISCVLAIWKTMNYAISSRVIPLHTVSVCISQTEWVQFIFSIVLNFNYGLKLWIIFDLITQLFAERFK